MGHMDSLDPLRRAFFLARHPESGYPVTLTAECRDSVPDPAQRWTLTVGGSVAGLGWKVTFSSEYFTGPEAISQWLTERGYLITLLLDSRLGPLLLP